MNKDANRPNQYGVMPLFDAINFGSVDDVHKLLIAGADVNYVSWNGVSPWYLAVESKDMGKIHLLEKFNADKTIQNNLGNNALHLTAMSGDVRLFHYLIHHSPQEAIIATNNQGNNLLHLAYSWDNMLIMKIILTHTEISIDDVTLDNETLFLKAIKKGNLTMAKFFMEHNCNIYTADSQNTNAVLGAIKYLPNNEESDSFIFELLDKSVNPDLFNTRDEFPLLLAIQQSRPNIVKKLLSYEININREINLDKYIKINLIIFAVLNSKLEFAKMLLTARANVNSIYAGKTLLYQALMEQDKLMVELLISYGAKLNKEEEKILFYKDEYTREIIRQEHIKQELIEKIIKELDNE